MKGNTLFVVLLSFVLGTSLLFSAACGDDDDDDDDDTHPCGDYDLVVDGETNVGVATTGWTCSLTINAENNELSGIIAPDNSVDPYDVSGVRINSTTGELDGSFPTEADWAEVCDAATIYNHIAFTIVDGVLDGDVTFYCGSTDAADEIGTYPSSGNVTCGSFDI